MLLFRITESSVLNKLINAVLCGVFLFHKHNDFFIFCNGEFMRKCIIIILVFAFLLLLCSCTKVIVNSADELTSYSYSKEFENGNIVSLSFDENNATLSMKTKRGDKAVISGFCEISDSEFVIFDSKTYVSYPFGYRVHYDSVDIMYDTNVLTLDKL